MACNSCPRRVLPVLVDSLFSDTLHHVSFRNSRIVRRHSLALTKVDPYHRASYGKSRRFHSTWLSESRHVESNCISFPENTQATQPLDYTAASYARPLSNSSIEHNTVNLEPEIEPDGCSNETNNFYTNTTSTTATAEVNTLTQAKGSRNEHKRQDLRMARKERNRDVIAARRRARHDSTALEQKNQKLEAQQTSPKAPLPVSGSARSQDDKNRGAALKVATISHGGKEEKPSEPRTTKQRHEPWQVQKAALKAKFKDGAWNPRKRLSPEALEGIRALHAQYPDQFTTPALAEQFKVSPEAIRRILKSKWRPSEEEEQRRQQRWDKRGEKIWTQKVGEGVHPPKKWREMGIGLGPRRKAQERPLITSNREARL